jgi:bifunctional non-homologous end joining protein LigD
MLWRNSPGRSRRTPPAGFILPCQPRLVDKPPTGAGWLHEVKHDGYRILARKDGSRVTLWSRYGTNFTDRLPKIVGAICGLAAESALIDGEAVAVRSDGHSDFAALRTKAGSARAYLVAFDLLNLNGEDFRKRPIEERRAALSPLVAGVGGILFSDALGSRGAARVRQSLRAGPGGYRLEARRQPIFERKQPAMAEVEEPGLREDVTRPRRRGRPVGPS